MGNLSCPLYCGFLGEPLKETVTLWLPLLSRVVIWLMPVLDSFSPAYPLDLYVWETVSGHISSLIPTWVLLNFKLTVGV